MKYLLIILASLTLFSCSQDPAVMASGSDEPEISFDIAGVHQSYTGSIGASGAKAQGAVNALYSFTGYVSTSNEINFIIATDSLKVKTYHVTGNGGIANITGFVYGYVMQGDYLDITITSYQGGVVNGTFTGNLSKVVSSNGVFQPTAITGGVIKNLHVRY